MSRIYANRTTLAASPVSIVGHSVKDSPRHQHGFASNFAITGQLSIIFVFESADMRTREQLLIIADFHKVQNGKKMNETLSCRDKNASFMH
jgi:hypothetical protein